MDDRHISSKTGAKEAQRQTTKKLGTQKRGRKFSLRPIKQSSIAHKNNSSLNHPLRMGKGTFYNLDEEVEIPKGFHMAYYDTRYRFAAKNSPDAVRKYLLKNRVHDKKSGEKEDKRKKM